MKKICAFIILLAAGVCSVAAQGFWGNQPADDPTGYKDTYKDWFTVGVAVKIRNVTDPDQMALIRKNFNSITAENAMKPGSLQPEEGKWNWEDADRIADFCRENGIPLRGHCLCWHNQFADWMFLDDNGNAVSKEVFYERLRTHIRTVVDRYKDIVYCWDVVNEAIDDPHYRAGFLVNPHQIYRKSRHYELCGEEFIAKAFEFAHEADPDAILFYNDYNAADPVKRERIYTMVKTMKEAGVPIHGIGMQGHYNIYGPDPNDVEAAIELYSSVVDQIHFTEIDIRINEDMGGGLVFNNGRTRREAGQHEKILQEARYTDLFRILRKHKDVVRNATFWNLGDKDSWLGPWNQALPFDVDYKPKRVYGLIKNFDPALDNQEIIEDFRQSELNQPGQEYPMVNSQGYARFRFVAPDAKSVIVSLGLGGRGGTVLHKDADGVWTGTTEGPMDEGFHYYHLIVDGAVVNDPGANNYYGSVRWESGIEIPAHDRDFYAVSDVPHGKVVQVLYPSKETGSTHRAFVYLPPQYDGKKKFPVLYLQHGWGEDETAWIRQGHANLIMDNLIAEGKCVPFMIVMTYGMTNEVKFGGLRNFDFTVFERVLVDDLIPYIDSSFRTIAKKDSRAMAGLSMGGMETKNITMARPEVFSYYGLMSGGTYSPDDIRDKDQVKMIFMSCGSKEFPDGVKKAAEALDAAGFNVVSYVSEDTAHEFLTWRRSLREMAPLLFRK